MQTLRCQTMGLSLLAGRTEGSAGIAPIYTGFVSLWVLSAWIWAISDTELCTVNRLTLSQPPRQGAGVAVVSN